MIPPVFSSFYNNPCLKDIQAFYAKESPISSPDPITSPAILTPFLVLPSSLLFDPRYFFVPKELLPPKKRICSSSSSSTTLSNSSRNQTCNLVSPSFLVSTSTPPQVFEIGKCSDKMTTSIIRSFSSMNILTILRSQSDYFPTSAGSSSFNSSENPKENMIPPVFSSFYKNPCLKDVQAFYAKELPISPPDPITSLAILTPSPILPPH
ncbi:hypothetical protein Tco_0536257 [Tanacetum coccineum]